MFRFKFNSESFVLALLILLNSIGPIGLLITPGAGFHPAEKDSILVMSPPKNMPISSLSPVVDGSTAALAETGQWVWVHQDFSAEKTLNRFGTINFILLLLLFYIRKRKSKRGTA